MRARSPLGTPTTIVGYISRALKGGCQRQHQHIGAVGVFLSRSASRFPASTRSRKRLAIVPLSSLRESKIAGLKEEQKSCQRARTCKEHRSGSTAELGLAECAIIPIPSTGIMAKTGACLADDLWNDGMYVLKKPFLQVIVCTLLRIRLEHGFLLLIAGGSGVFRTPAVKGSQRDSNMRWKYRQGRLGSQGRFARSDSHSGRNFPYIV
jgi:hypothetical protein